MRQRRSKSRAKPAIAPLAFRTKSLSYENSGDKQPESPLQQPCCQSGNGRSKSSAQFTGIPNGSFNSTNSPLFPSVSDPIQTKLTVGALDGKFEKEADRVAEKLPSQKTKKRKVISPLLDSAGYVGGSSHSLYEP